MARLLLASLTIVTLLTAACTANRPWPAYPVATASSAWTPSSQVATIDLLPLDLELWTDPSYEVDLVDLHDAAETSIMSLVTDALAARTYKVVSRIDAFGFYTGGMALSQADLHATLDALARYGAVAAAAPGRLPVPYLPARLGKVTGADATLYIGGWGFLAAPPPQHESSNDSLGVAALFAALIALFIVAEAASSHANQSTTTAQSGDDTGHTATTGTGHTATAGTIRAGTGQSTSIVVRSLHDHRVGVVTGMIDAFGRAATDLAIAASEAPDWYDDPALPHEGGQSTLYLEMTLVDNHTGRVLWHAHQEFPASAEQPDDIARAARTMVEALPGRAGPPTAQAH